MQNRWIWTVGTALLIFLWIVHRFVSPYLPAFTAKEEAPAATFALVDPEQAPANLKPLVMRGFQILFETKKNLPEYAGDRISCTNCHFSAGNSFGGKQEGFSLVGVTKVYPKKLDDGSLYILPERINSCFLKSTNGKALPIDSEPMKAMVAYLDWISRPVAALPKLPWLGIKPLRSNHKPDAQQGSHVYAAKCALCHGTNGDGQEREYDLSYPPIWGDHSFNDGAGMYQLPTLASFVYHNMPYHEPNLSVEDALDVAAFVISQPRPHFIPPNQ